MKLIKKADPDLCEGPFLRKIILYTVPIILTSLLQLLFNAADLIVLGNFCGGHSVGAVGATGSLINLMVNLFFGLSVGAGHLDVVDTFLGLADGGLCALRGGDQHEYYSQQAEKVSVCEMFCHKYKYNN